MFFLVGTRQKNYFKKKERENESACNKNLFENDE